MRKKSASKASKSTKSTKSAKKVAKVTKVAAAKVKAVKLVKEPMSKSQLINTLVESSGLARKQISTVLDSFIEIVYAHFRKGGAGLFNFPGIMKLYVVRKPATKARKGVNPFTGQEMMFKAKPARNVIKARALKKLKDAAA